MHCAWAPGTYLRGHIGLYWGLLMKLILCALLLSSAFFSSQAMATTMCDSLTTAGWWCFATVTGAKQTSCGAAKFVLFSKPCTTGPYLDYKGNPHKIQVLGPAGT